MAIVVVFMLAAGVCCLVWALSVQFRRWGYALGYHDARSLGFSEGWEAGYQYACERSEAEIRRVLGEEIEEHLERLHAERKVRRYLQPIEQERRAA